MTPLDLLVLGDANPDLVLAGGDVVPAFGQAEHVVDEARLVVGGSGAIIACGAARLGLDVALVAVVGDDPLGALMRSELEARGVDTAGLVVDPSLPTGLSVVLSGERDRAILTHVGAIAALRLDLVDTDLLASARHVHVSSYFLHPGLVPDLPGLFARLRADGTTTSVDPNWDPSETWDAQLLDLLADTDVFLPNEVEATRLARTSSIDDAARGLAERAGIVVVKRGAECALACVGESIMEAPAVPTTVVDTTGAGDSFDAGFLVGWLADRPLADALRLASACGSASTRALGGVAAQPTMEEAEALLSTGSPA